MATIIGGIATTHVPAIGNAIARGLQNDPYWSPFFDGFKSAHAWLSVNQPDVVVVVYNDHGLNFFLDKMPTFAIGAAADYRHEDEGWGIGGFKPFVGHSALSWHVIEQVVGDEFDPVTCQSMLVDHGVCVPFELCWPNAQAWPVRLVPICLNTVQHPLMSPRRALALGRSIGRALESWPGDEKIVVLGTGGLSHQLDGERAGHINVDYDKFCLRNILPDPEALTGHDTLDIVELAGSQGVEILNWLAARGALTGSVRELAHNYHVPISNTAAATLLAENRATVAA